MNSTRIERFSNECHKTKTKVITLANQKGTLNQSMSEVMQNQSNLLITFYTELKTTLYYMDRIRNVNENPLLWLKARANSTFLLLSRMLTEIEAILHTPPLPLQHCWVCVCTLIIWSLNDVSMSTSIGTTMAATWD